MLVSWYTSHKRCLDQTKQLNCVVSFQLDHTQVTQATQATIFSCQFYSKMPFSRKRVRNGFSRIMNTILNPFRSKKSHGRKEEADQQTHAVPSSNVVSSPDQVKMKTKIGFRNRLPYDLSIQIQDVSGKNLITFDLTAGTLIKMTPEEDYSLVATLNYLDHEWTFSTKFSQLSDVTMAEFKADDKSIHLGWKMNEPEEYTIFSPFRITNESEHNIDYLQVVQGPGYHRAMKISSTTDPKQPILLNIDLIQLFVSLSDNPSGEKWTNVPLGDDYSKIECYDKNELAHFVDVYVFENSRCEEDLYRMTGDSGKTITLITYNESAEEDSEEAVWSEGDQDAMTFADDNHSDEVVTFSFQNYLPYSLFVNQVHENRIAVKEEMIENGQDITVGCTRDSILKLHFFYLGEKWILEGCLDDIVRSNYSEFKSSESGEVLRLLNQWTLGEEPQMHRLSLYSRICVVNATDSDLVYLQRIVTSDNLQDGFVQTYHPRTENDQPILLNADLDLLFFANVNDNDDENWTAVPFDCDGTHQIDMLINGNIETITARVCYSSISSSLIIFTK